METLEKCRLVSVDSHRRHSISEGEGGDECAAVGLFVARAFEVAAKRLSS
jgi:hypothetical protein